MKTIGAVSVFGPGIYEVADEGARACPNGDPGHAVHLTSRTKDPRHQLSDAVIDSASMRFCSVRLTLQSGPVGVAAYWEGHYAEVGGYWMLTDALVAAKENLFGIAASHGVWRYRLLDMTFPESLPSNIFAPVPQPT